MNSLDATVGILTGFMCFIGLIGSVISIICFAQPLIRCSLTIFLVGAMVADFFFCINQSVSYVGSILISADLHTDHSYHQGNISSSSSTVVVGSKMGSVVNGIGGTIIDDAASTTTHATAILQHSSLPTKVLNSTLFEAWFPIAIGFRQASVTSISAFVTAISIQRLLVAWEWSHWKHLVPKQKALRYSLMAVLLIFAVSLIFNLTEFIHPYRQGSQLKKIQISDIYSILASHTFTSSFLSTVNVLLPMVLVSAVWLAVITIVGKTLKKRQWMNPNKRWRRTRSTSDYPLLSPHNMRYSGAIAVLFLATNLLALIIISLEWSSQRWIEENEDNYMVILDVDALLRIINSSLKAPIFYCSNLQYRTILNAIVEYRTLWLPTKKSLEGG